MDMNLDLLLVFNLNLVIHFILLCFILWSIIFPKNRIWPPPKTLSWQYLIYWGLFYLGVIIDIYIIFNDWNTWNIPFEIRYYIGLPLFIVGSSFSVWSIAVLGIKNTTGLKDGFVVEMPYHLTRNPQYVGDIIMIIGLILLVNSLFITVLLLLTIVIFCLMPFPEEIWLEEKYSEDYLNYKYKTSRFL